MRKRIFAITLAIAIGSTGMLVGAMNSNRNTLSTKAASTEVIDNKAVTIRGEITGIKPGVDGQTLTVKSGDKDYSVTMSAVNSEIIGAYSYFKVGAEIEVIGEVWGTNNISTSTVRQLKGDITYISNLKVEVLSIENGLDGITATLRDSFGDEYITTMSISSTEFPIGELNTIQVGSTLNIFGSVYKMDDATHITSEVVLYRAEQDESNREIEELKEIKGSITGTEPGVDGQTLTIKSGDKDYSVTMSAVNTEIIGDYDYFKKGAEVLVMGEVWGDNNITASTIKQLEGDITDVWNLRVEVLDITPGRDGITAKIKDSFGVEYESTISISTTDVPIGAIKDIAVGSTIEVSGEVYTMDGTNRITASVVLVR